MSQPSFDSIRRVINNAATATVVPDESFQQHDGLLLLDWRTDITGFTILDDDPTIRFRRAYQHFKSLYRENKARWDKRSLSFVLCRVSQRDTEDEFFSQVESDPFFCRKYVIRYFDDMEEFGKEIGRLPFLPIPRIGDASYILAPSAKQVLEALGFPADLRRALVEPGKRSAESLAYDIKQKAISFPVFSEKNTREVAELSRGSTASQVRVQSLQVKAFRAYKGSQTFDLNAPITVLYGQNGLGKTSVFDAIDFACTGRIGRLLRSKRSAEEFAQLATHLDCDAAESRVVIELAGNLDAESERFHRSVTDWNHAWKGKERFDRRGFLEYLAGVSDTSRDSRPDVSKLESLFRATHLFGQDDQELLLKFRHESVIPNELFSRMIALDDYTEAIRKTDSLSREIAKWSQSSSKQLEECRDALSTMEESVSELRERLAETSRSANVTDISIEVGSLSSSLGLTVSKPVLDRQLATELSSIAKREQLHVEEEVNSLGEIVKTLTKIQNEIEAETKDSVELEAYEKAATESNKSKAKLGIQIEDVKRELAKTEGDARADANRLDGISRWRELEIVRIKIAEARLQISESLATAAKDVEEIGKHLDNESERARGLLEQINATLKRRGEVEAQIQNASTVLAKLEDQEGFRSSEQEVIQKLAKSAQLMQDRKAERDELEVKRTALRSKVDDLSVAYEHSTAHEEELTKLLDALQRFVSGKECPACGSVFSDTKAVIESITSRKGTRTAELNALFQNLNDAQRDLEHSSGELNKMEQMVDRLKLEICSLTEKRENLQARIAANDADLQRQGLIDSSADPKAVLKTRIEQWKRERLVLEQQLEKGRAETQLAEANVSRFEEKLKRAKEHFSELQNAFQRANGNLEDIRAEQHEKSKTLKLEAEDDKRFAAEQQDCRERREGLREAISGMHTRLAELDSEKQTLDEREQFLRDQQSAIEKRRLERSRFFARIRGLCGRIGIEFPPVEPVCDEAKKKLELRERSVQELRRKLGHLVAAHEVSDLRQSLVDEEKVAKELTGRLNSFVDDSRSAAENMKQVEKLHLILSSKRQSGFSEHIRTYGPLISILQQRLRSVFGFSGVSLAAKKDGVLVNVGWGERRVKPVDYFSDAQKQILALSVFLGSCLRQNWSGFRPILLDDPITHFDDFNAHAFVELIRGLTSTEPERWQFVISTCEERLYSLMRKKFSSIGNARFYHFKGMRGDGPIVSAE